MLKVGVLGASGFIGSHISKKVIENGFSLRASVRNKDKKEKYEHLYGLNKDIEIVESDVLDKASLEKFAEGLDVIIHSATPFLLETENVEKDLLDPTITGTLNVLEVAKNSPKLKKLIFISSVAAINGDFPLLPPNTSSDYVFTEKDYANTNDESVPYGHAKNKADQLIQEFVDTNKDLAFEVVSLCPTLSVGAPLSGRDDSTSVGLQYLLKNKIPANPFLEMALAQDLEWAVVSVEDIGLAATQAIKTEGIHGERFIISSETRKTSDVSRILNNESPLNEASLVYDNSKAKKLLKINFQSSEDALSSYVKALA